MMRQTMRYRILACLCMGLATTAARAASPAPDPASWQPASIAGPVLFIGEVTQTEAFRNPPNVDYACHAVMTGEKKNSTACISNACGLERISLKTQKVIAGEVPSTVTLNRILGEWCEGVTATGRKFLVAILPDKRWSVFEIMDDGSDPLVLPNLVGCLGEVDIKPLLGTQGTELPSAYDAKKMRWRTEWGQGIHTQDCDAWIPKSQTNRALTLDALTKAWNCRRH